MDKYLLVKKILNPKIYVSYVCILNLLVLIIIPFVGFYLPEIKIIAFSFLIGAVFFFALFWFFKALGLFEASRVVPTVGGVSPIFSLILIYLFSIGKEKLTLLEFLAFILLILGSVLITYDRTKRVSFQIFKLSLLSALLFSLYFVLLKYVYLFLPFWQGLIWTRIGTALTAFIFLLSFSETRQEFFGKRFASLGVRPLMKIVFTKTTPFLFILTRIIAGTAGLLQTWAVFLAPIAFLPIVNALQGTQYVFLLFLASFISFKFPRILQEEISRQTIFQKILSILLIGMGLAILAFFQ